TRPSGKGGRDALPPFLARVSSVKWIPAARRQRALAATFLAQNQLCFLRDSPNRRQLYALEYSRHRPRLLRCHCKQQFVIVATVQREFQGIEVVLPRSIQVSCPRDSCAFQTRAHSTRGAQARQVAREAVRKIHHGASE